MTSNNHILNELMGKYLKGYTINSYNATTQLEPTVELPRRQRLRIRFAVNGYFVSATNW